MLFKSGVDIGHFELHDSLLDVNGLQKAGETWRKDRVHGIGSVQARKSRIDPFWPKIAEKSRGYWTHALNIAAMSTP